MCHDRTQQHRITAASADRIRLNITASVSVLLHSSQYYCIRLNITVSAPVIDTGLRTRGASVTGLPADFLLYIDYGAAAEGIYNAADGIVDKTCRININHEVIRPAEEGDAEDGRDYACGGACEFQSPGGALTF